MEQLAQEGVTEEIMFILLNLLFFSILTSFVIRAGAGAYVYEQAYAKEIALLIDDSHPYTEINLYAKDMLTFAESNGIEKEEIVKFDDKTNQILVKLALKGGYSFKTFTDASLEFSFQGDYLKITISENKI